MRYWWASQGKNYQHVAQTGNLWTCPRANGDPLRSRRFIKDLAAGDLVFHYANKELRAVSRVTAPWVPWPRPEHYPANAGEGDEGWLVRTEPIVTGLHVPHRVIATVVTHGGEHRPLNRNGKANQIYLAELRPADAAGMLQLIGTDAVPEEDGAQAAADDTWMGESTSVVREALVRREQAALREHLLDGAAHGTCDLCGRELPSELLVAAHIVPRHRLTDDERRDLNRVAMLACVLGCDALFEHGHIAVDGSGTVQALTDPEASDLAAFVKDLSGHRCTAYASATAGGFAEHYSHALSRRQEDSVRR